MHIKSMGPGTWSEALLTKARKGESPDAWKVRLLALSHSLSRSEASACGPLLPLVLRYDC